MFTHIYIYVYTHISVCVCVDTYVATRNLLHLDLREGCTLRKIQTLFSYFTSYPITCEPALPPCVQEHEVRVHNVYLGPFPLLPPSLPFKEGGGDCLKPVFSTKLELYGVNM